MDDTKSISGKSSVQSQKIKNISDLIKAAADKKDTSVNAERKLLFRPKIHEIWKDENVEDEIEVRRRHLTAEAEKEYKVTELRERDSLHSLDEEEVDEINEEKREIHETLFRLRNRKQREARYKLKIEAYEKQKADDYLRREQEIFESEKNNPSKWGFYYTDGYYENNGYFGVKDELLEQLVEEGEEWTEKWNAKYPETFTEKFRRYFWPPKLFFKNSTFRTRGSYLDFPEVIADWPTPLEISYGRTKMQMLSASLPIFVPNENGDLMEFESIKHLLKQLEEPIEEDEVEEDLGQSHSVLEMTEQERYYGNKKEKGLKKKNKIGVPLELRPEDWYYDDEMGEFYQKKLGFEVEYYYDMAYGVYRKKRKEKKGDRVISPYDYYWDSDSGKFLNRGDYKGIDVFTYDDALAVYKLIKVVKEPLKERYMIRVVDENEPKKVDLSVADYFFDESSGRWNVKKEAVDEIRKEVTWDEMGKRFAFKSEGSWRGLTGYSPDDYYFDVSTGKFVTKPARQGAIFKYESQDGVWKKSDASKSSKKVSKTKCSDYYFDLIEGQFKLRAVGQDKNYGYQKYAKLHYKKPDTKSGMFPGDYYWDRDRKLWLPRVLRMELMKNTRSGMTPSVLERAKGMPASNLQDTYYWDTEEGDFFKKDPYEAYHFDEKDKVWKSDKLRDKPKNQKYFGDFFWDETSRKFILKDVNAVDDVYAFDEKYYVWKKRGVPLKPDGNPLPKDFVFDLDKKVFLRKEDVSEQNIIPNGDGPGFKIPANPNTKGPDSFWFNDSEGRFYPKNTNDMKQYYFKAEEGVWKKKGIVGPPATGFYPNNFYYDDAKNSFKLKVAGQDREYFYDKGNKIFRHVTVLGKTKNGLKPDDFRWNVEVGLYVPAKGDRSGIFSEQLKWDPERRYDKPWLLSQVGTSAYSKSTYNTQSRASSLYPYKGAINTSEGTAGNQKK